MKRALPILLLAASVECGGCASAMKAAATPPQSKEPAAAEEMVDHSGDSPQTAIAVPADAPNAGIDFENQWMSDQYGRFRRDGGGTGTLEGRRYDVVKIELANGEKKTVYFDITELWARSLQQH